MEKTIAQLVREMEESDKNGYTTTSKYVKVNMREDINVTQAYLNSKHISGDKDHLGREKPFYNIVLAARNVWYRATDIDRKNIQVRASSVGQTISAFLATIVLQEWMKKVNFGKFLNDWGLSLADNGSTITKFIEKNGELVPKVMDWNYMLVDPVDFENNIKIEKIWFTPAQLRKQKGYNQEVVEEMLANTKSRETLEGESKDNKDDYVEIYEVHGELPLAYLTDDEEDEETYVQQMHVVSFQANNEGTKDKFNDYTLYKGREAKDPYFITHLIKKDGITYTGGAVKNLFDAQWMVNHAQKLTKDQLDLASKQLFQTPDDSFQGKNAISHVENGDILVHKANSPLTQLNNQPNIMPMQSFQASWQSIANQINNLSESLLGQNPPSGTAWRQTQALLQESHSLFELKTENKGLALEEMLRIYVLPYIKKQLDNTDEIFAVLEDHQIKQFDSMYVPNEVIRRLNNKKIDTILSGEIYDPTQEANDALSIEQAVRGELDVMGKQRPIKPSEIDNVTWKKIFEDLEWKLDIDVTGESRDANSMLATINTLISILASNPGALQDENTRMLFNKALSISGAVSPLELQTPKAQPQPAMAMVGGNTPMGLPMNK